MRKGSTAIPSHFNSPTQQEREESLRNLERVTLYIDNDEQQQLATEILRQINVKVNCIDLRKSASYDIQLPPPMIMTHLGYFGGLDGIQQYVRLYRQWKKHI